MTPLTLYHVWSPKYHWLQLRIEVVVHSSSTDENGFP